MAEPTRTIQVLALHDDEFDAFTPTPEQEAQIASGDLIIGRIRYAPNPDYVAPATTEASPQ